jgi:transcriptional regulator with XRE-family HTH domain
MATPLLPDLLMMEFAERLLKLRKEKHLTQKALADLAGLHVVQVRRYETNASQPSLEAIRKLAIALSVSADALLFDEDERGPNDALALQFEAVSHLPPDEQRVVMEVLEGLIIKYQARRWDTARTATAK